MKPLKNYFILGLLFCAALMPFGSMYSQNYTTDGNKITITTDREKGEWLICVVTNFLKPGYDDETWIDWNNNGKYDKDEEIFTGPNAFKHEQISKTITIYGNVKYFLCVKQELVSIDVTKCPTLSTLHVSRNKFKTLDLSNCPNLRYLYLNSNEVSALDLKNKSDLFHVECVMNNLSKETMMQLAEDLADRTGLDEDGTEKSTGNIYVLALQNTEKNVCPKEAVDKIKAKNWNVYAYKDYDDPEKTIEVPYEGTPTAIYEPNVSDNKLSVYPNPATTTVNVSVPESYIGQTINLVSMNGSIVLTQKILQQNTVMDVSTVPAGNYVVMAGSSSYRIEIVK